MDLFIGEDTVAKYRDNIATGTRIGVITGVNLDIEADDPDLNSSRVHYATLEITMVDPPGQQTQIRIPTTSFTKTSGRFDIPEPDSFVFCVPLRNGRVVVFHMGSAGDIDVDRTVGDLVRNNVLPQMQEGEHHVWTDNKVFQMVRKCNKVVKSTIGKVLDFTKNAIQFDNKDLHAQLEHESGTKLSLDEDGNVIMELPANIKFFVNQAGSTATDNNALVTKAFLTSFYNDFVTKYLAHTHPETGAVTGPPTPPGPSIVSPTLPDTVSTPDIRAKNT